MTVVDILHHVEVKKFIKFGLVGVINTALDMGVFILLNTVFHVYYLVANIFAFLISGSNSYFLNRRWTFQSANPNWRREMMKYLIVITSGFMINEGLLYVLVAHANLSNIFAKLIVTAFVLIWNFGINRLWTFRHSSAA